MTKLIPMTEQEKHLAEKHLHLVPQTVASLTRPYSNLPDEESDELVQIGYLALCRSAMRHDASRPFEPYARTAIRHAIYDYWRKCRQHKEHSCSLEEFLSGDDSSSREMLLYKQNTEKQPEAETIAASSSAYLEVLSGQNSTVIQKGIAALCLQQQGYKSTDLAKLYGVPANHVRAWQSKARKKLKQDQELYALLA